MGGRSLGGHPALSRISQTSAGTRLPFPFKGSAAFLSSGCRRRYTSALVVPRGLPHGSNKVAVHLHEAAEHSISRWSPPRAQKSPHTQGGRDGSPWRKFRRSHVRPMEVRRRPNSYATVANCDARGSVLAARSARQLRSKDFFNNVCPPKKKLQRSDARLLDQASRTRNPRRASRQ